MGEALIVRKGGGNNAPLPVLIDKTFVENGLYQPSDYNADGFNNVIVNVPDETNPIETSLLVPIYNRNVRFGGVLRAGKFAIITEGSNLTNGTVKLVDLSTGNVLHTTTSTFNRVPTVATFDEDGDIVVESTGTSSSLSTDVYFRWVYTASSDTWTYFDTNTSGGTGTGITKVFKGKDFGIIRGYSSPSYNSGNIILSGIPSTIRDKREPFYAFGTKFEYQDGDYTCMYYTRPTDEYGQSSVLKVLSYKTSDKSYNNLRLIGNENDSFYWSVWQSTPDCKYLFQCAYLNYSGCRIYKVANGQRIYSSSTGFNAKPSGVLYWNNGFFYYKNNQARNININTSTDEVTVSTITNLPTSFSGASCYYLGNNVLFSYSGGTYIIDRSTNTATQLNSASGYYSYKLSNTDYYIASNSGSQLAYIYRIGQGIIKTFNSDKSINIALFLGTSTSVTYNTLTTGVKSWNVYNNNYYKLIYCETEDEYYLEYIYSGSGVLSDDNYFAVYKNVNVNTENTKICLINANGFSSIVDLNITSFPTLNIGTSSNIFLYNNKKYFELTYNSSANIYYYDSTNDSLNFSKTLSTTTFVPACPGGNTYQTQGNYIVFAPIIKNSIYVLNTRSYTNTTGNHCIYFNTVTEEWNEFSNCAAAHIQTYDTNIIVYRSNTSPYHVFLHDITNNSDTDTGYVSTSSYTFVACNNGNIFIAEATNFVKYSLIDNTSEVLYTHTSNSYNSSYAYIVAVSNKLVGYLYQAVYYGESTITKYAASTFSASPWFTYIDDTHCYISGATSSSNPVYRYSTTYSINFTNVTVTSITGLYLPISYTSCIMLKPNNTTNYYLVVTRMNVTGGTEETAWKFVVPNSSLRSYTLDLSSNTIGLAWDQNRTNYYDLDTSLLSSSSGFLGNTTYKYYLMAYGNVVILIDKTNKKIYNYLTPYISAPSAGNTNLTYDQNSFNYCYETTSGLLLVSTIQY